MKVDSALLGNRRNRPLKQSAAGHYHFVRSAIVLVMLCVTCSVSQAETIFQVSIGSYTQLDNARRALETATQNLAVAIKFPAQKRSRARFIACCPVPIAADKKRNAPWPSRRTTMLLALGLSVHRAFNRNPSKLRQGCLRSLETPQFNDRHQLSLRPIPWHWMAPRVYR